MLKKLTLLGLISVFSIGIVGCETDMVVENNNAPDTKRVLTTPADLEGLLGGTFYNFWDGWQSFPALGFSVHGYENSSSWGNFGMKEIRNEPPLPWNNSPSASYAYVTEDVWYASYRLLSSVNEVLRQMNEGLSFNVAGQTGDDKDNRARAFAKWMQGLAHAQVALLFDQGFIFDENLDLSAGVPALHPYGEIMASAISYFEEAIALSGTQYTLPGSWINGITVTNEDIKRWSHHFIARYTATVARTAAERAAVNWSSVKSHAEQGIRTESQLLAPEGDNDNWWDAYKSYGTYYIWAKVNVKMIGYTEDYDKAIAMGADPSTGTYKGWLAQDPSTRRNFDIWSTDRRVTASNDDPQTDGKYMIYEDRQRFREARGTYSFSNYRFTKYTYHANDYIGPMPFAIKNEADMLIAEAELRAGNLQAAADLINISRVGLGEMAPVDGSMPAQTLWDAMMYEKRIEGYMVWSGGAFADLRGWTDHDDEFIQWPAQKWLHMPIPGKELEVLLMGTYTFGGGTNPSGESPKITVDYINKLRNDLIKASKLKRQKYTIIH